MRLGGNTCTVVVFRQHFGSMPQHTWADKAEMRYQHSCKHGNQKVHLRMTSVKCPKMFHANSILRVVLRNAKNVTAVSVSPILPLYAQRAQHCPQDRSGVTIKKIKSIFHKHVNLPQQVSFIDCFGKRHTNSDQSQRKQDTLQNQGASQFSCLQVLLLCNALHLRQQRQHR